MDGKSTVFVVDDDPGALQSMCWLIEEEDLPVRAFPSGLQFLEAYDPCQGGCLVLDVRMPEMTGLEVQRRLAERGIGFPIIFLTAHGNVATCANAFRAGAFDFLEKPVDDQLLLGHIRKALARDVQLRRGDTTTDFDARLATLSRCEKIVFDMLIIGKALKEIAAATNVTVPTAWKHRTAILKKMAVDNDIELTRIATQRSNTPRR